MAITHQGTGTRGTGTTTTTPTLSGAAAGRLALAGRTVKPSTATAAVEAGWSQKVNVTGGTGSQGIDTGPQRLAIDAKVLAAAEGNPTFDQASSPNAVVSAATIYSPSAGKLIWPQFSNGNDTSHGAGRSATSAAIDLEVDDVIWVYVASDTDFNSGAWTGPTISVSAGAVGATTARMTPGGSSTGQDVGNAVYEATVTTAAAGATITFSTNADGQANCGQVGFAVLRESAMSYTSLLAGTSAEGHGTGAHTTASFTPEANSLLVVCVSAGTSASGNDILANLSIADSAGLTYTSGVSGQENAATGVSSYAARIYTAPVGGSPASMTLTFDAGALNVFAYHYVVFCITGADLTSPHGASGTVDNNGTGTLALTLGAAPAVDSFVVGYVLSDVNAGGTTNTLPGPDFTEVAEAATSVPNQWVEAELRTGSTSTTVDWTDTDAGTATTFYRLAVGLEIKIGAGGGPVNVAWTPGELTVSPVAWDATPGQVSAAWTPGTLTASPVAWGSTPQPVAIAWEPGTLTLDPVAWGAAPTPPSIVWEPGTLTLDPVAWGATPQPVAVAWTPGALTLDSVAWGASPQPVTIPWTPGEFAVDPVAWGATPQPVTVVWTPGDFTVDPVAWAIGGATIAWTPGALTLEPVAWAVTPLPVAVPWTPGQLILEPVIWAPAAQPITILWEPGLLTIVTVAWVPLPPVPVAARIITADGPWPSGGLAAATGAPATGQIVASPAGPAGTVTGPDEPTGTGTLITR